MKKIGRIRKRIYAMVLVFLMAFGSIPFSGLTLTAKAEGNGTKKGEGTIKIATLEQNGATGTKIDTEGFVISTEAYSYDDYYQAKVTLPDENTANSKFIGIDRDGTYDVAVSGWANVLGHSASVDKTLNLSVPEPYKSNAGKAYNFLYMLWTPSSYEPDMVKEAREGMRIKKLLFNNTELPGGPCSIYDTPDQTITVTVQENTKLIGENEFDTADISALEPSSGTSFGTPVTIPFEIKGSEEGNNKVFTATSTASNSSDYDAFKALLKKYGEKSEGDPSITLDQVQVRADGDALWIRVPEMLGTPGMGGSGAGSITTNALIKVTGLSRKDGSGNETGCADKFVENLNTILKNGIKDEDSLLAAVALLNKCGGIDSKNVNVTVTFEAEKEKLDVKADEVTLTYTGKELEYDTGNIQILTPDVTDQIDFKVSYDKTPIGVGTYTVTISWGETAKYAGGSISTSMVIEAPTKFNYDYTITPGKTMDSQVYGGYYYKTDSAVLELTNDSYDDGVRIVDVKGSDTVSGEAVSIKDSNCAYIDADGKTITFTKTFYNVIVVFEKEINYAAEGDAGTTSLLNEEETLDTLASEEAVPEEEEAATEGNTEDGKDTPEADAESLEDVPKADAETIKDDEDVPEADAEGLKNDADAAKDEETAPETVKNISEDDDASAGKQETPEMDADAAKAGEESSASEEDEVIKGALSANVSRSIQTLSAAESVPVTLSVDGTQTGTLTADEPIGHVILETKELVIDGTNSEITVSGSAATILAVPDTDNGIVSVVYSYNGITEKRTKDEGNLREPFTISKDGRYTVTATVKDAIGRQTVKIFAVVIDTEAPDVKIDKAGTDKADIKITINDLTTVTGKYELINHTTGKTTTGAVYSGTVSFTVSEGGTYTLKVTAADEMGNAAEKTLDFTIEVPDKPENSDKPGSSGGSHHSSGSSEPNYTYTGMVLKHEGSGILASGVSVKSTSVLKITEIPKTSFTSAAVQGSSFYKGYDVSIDGGFYETLKIHFPIGQAKNGQTATILQEKADGSVQTYIVTIVDGYATIDVTELGRFAVSLGGSNVVAVTPAGEQVDSNAKSPKTGEAAGEEAAEDDSNAAVETVSGVAGTVSITPENAPDFALYGGILAVLLLAAAMGYYFVMKKNGHSGEE